MGVQSPHVPVLRREARIALIALEPFRCLVCVAVTHESRVLGEAPTTHAALVRLVPAVRSHVTLQVRLTCERSGANPTFITPMDLTLTRDEESVPVCCVTRTRCTP